jgi:two-component system, NtrC family, response regulator HupR/HoxA
LSPNTGAHPVGSDLATDLIALAKVTADEAAAMAQVVPSVGEPDVARIRDLVASAAAAVERAQPAVIPPTTHTHPFTEIVGDAPAVRDVVKLLTKVVRSEATVLIHGESGTGKELIARAIHYHGPRAKKPFVVQNCSAFNDNLLESALFGHVRGAFTGAVKDQAGLFQVADDGTFFLDEIGDMSAALQVKLLRVLQEGTFMPVGGTKPVKVDVRIIAASHKDLASMVQHKQFREDLFYRVNVLKLTVPPLRDRVSDIPRLAQHFINKHWKSANQAPRLSQGALARLVAYPWPGNIRELENEIERMLVLAGDAQELTASMVSGRVSGIVGAAQSAPRPLRDSLANAEADTIVAALGRHSGDREAAAAELGTSRPYLEARMSALGLGSSA